MSSPHSHRRDNVKADVPIIENEEGVEREQQDEPELEENEPKSPVAVRSSNSTTTFRGLTELGTQQFPLLQQYQLEGNLLGGGQHQPQLIPQQQYLLMTTTSIMMPQQQAPPPRQTLVLQYSPSVANVATTRQGVATLQQQPVFQLQQPQYILIVGNHSQQQPQLSVAAPPALVSVGQGPPTATGGILPGNVGWQLALPPVNGTSQILGAQQLPTLVTDHTSAILSNTSAILSSTTANNNNIATYSSNGAWLPVHRPPLLQPSSFAPQMILQQQQQQRNQQMLAVLQSQAQGMAVPGNLIPQRSGSLGAVLVPTSTSSKSRPEDIRSSSTMQPRTNTHETNSNAAFAEAAVASSSPSRLPDEKPKRPLSAYNIFFKEERARMLEQLHNEPDEDENNNIIYEADGKKQRARKRRKRKSISFEELARQIGKKWQVVTADTKARYQGKADQDKQRYTREKALYLEAKRAEQNGVLVAVEEGENDDEVK